MAPCFSFFSPLGPSCSRRIPPFQSAHAVESELLCGSGAVTVGSAPGTPDTLAGFLGGHLVSERQISSRAEPRSHPPQFYEVTQKRGGGKVAVNI